MRKENIKRINRISRSNFNTNNIDNNFNNIKSINKTTCEIETNVTPPPSLSPQPGTYPNTSHVWQSVSIYSL